MFRLGLLLRALPSIVAELLGLVWYAYRGGDRRMAAAALTWLCSTLALAGFLVNGVLVAAWGGEVHLLGPVILASVPLAIWLANEAMLTVVSLLVRFLELFDDRVDARF